jgi:hypothetical protein
LLDSNQKDNSDFTDTTMDLKVAAPGDVQPSQVLLKETLSQDGGFDGSSLSRSNSAPRLSIRPGSKLSSREIVELWRT